MMKNLVLAYTLVSLLGWSCDTQPKVTVEFENSTFKIGEVAFTKSLNGGAKQAMLDSLGNLILNSGEKTDYFNEPDGSAKYHNAPLLLTEIDNSQPFTFVVKTTPQIDTTYDAGALYVYSSEDLWHKFAFEMDEHHQTRIVTVRTIETSDDNNHDTVNAASVYLKVSSDTKAIGFYYSTDKTEWQLVRIYKNDYPKKVYVGISSQSPLSKSIKTTFTECELEKKAVENFRLGK